jgi:hypothetical protein
MTRRGVGAAKENPPGIEAGRAISIRGKKVVFQELN